MPDVVAPPSGNPRFPAVDGLRALAALAVVVFHADQFSGAKDTPVGRLLIHFDVGVAIFFVITGFLLYRPYFASAVGDAPRTTTRVFYWRRVLRIVPGYWVALVALAPLLAFAHPAGIPNLAFVQIYRPAWTRTGIPPAWSVCVEVSFYLLLPVLATVLQRAWGDLERQRRRRRELTLIAALALASVLLRALLHHFIHDPYAVDPLPTTLAWFCGGMALAVISVDSGDSTRWLHRVARRHPAWLWIAAAGLYVPLLTTDHNPETASVLLFVAYGVIAVLILTPLVLGDPRSFAAGRIMLTKPVAWLGLISYGIYLYHYPIMSHLHIDAASRTVTLLVLAAVGGAIAAACGAVSYYVVERPTLRLKRVQEFPRVRRTLGL